MIYMKKLDINPEWYQNKNVRPKSFIVRMERSPGGKYRVAKAFVENTVNQYETDLQRVDVRDLTSDLRRKDIFAY